MNRALHIIIAAAALLACTTPAAEKPWTVYTEWPFDAAEAKHRQRETADALNIPVKKTITVGKDKNGLPVTMDFMLIPAGTFVMGTPEPVKPVVPTMPPDDTWISRLTFFVGLAAALSLLVLMTVRAVQGRRWPRFSLRGLILLVFAVSVMVMGDSREREAKLRLKAFRNALDVYEEANAQYQLEREWHTWKTNSFTIPVEEPHRVTITQPFYMGKTEVTNAQWQPLMGIRVFQFAGASKLTGANFPVVIVNWSACQTFASRLSALTGRKYRLPTEEEWEFACRSGSSSTFSFGSDQTRLGDYAWYSANSGITTNVVMAKKPNAWNLHDTHGNVWEWCQDWFEYYGAEAQKKSPGPDKNTRRVARGGDYSGLPQYSRSANRFYQRPNSAGSNIGFRLVLEIAPTVP